jgi:hypothetical protein
MPTIRELQAAGFESLRAIAAGLEERAFLRLAAANGPLCMRLLEAASLPFADANVVA